MKGEKERKRGLGLLIMPEKEKDNGKVRHGRTGKKIQVLTEDRMELERLDKTRQDTGNGKELERAEQDMTGQDRTGTDRRRQDCNDREVEAMK